MTFNVLGSVLIDTTNEWTFRFEAFCQCRHCSKTTTFVLESEGVAAAAVLQAKALVELPGSLNKILRVKGFISLKDVASETAPPYVPDNIKNAFDEGAKCLSVRCYNAAAAMFRLCLDFATKDVLKNVAGEIPKRVTYSLGHRLEWLFEIGSLPGTLKELSSCVKEDGNDGAHDGTLSKADALDLCDFTSVLLERLYTEPARLEQARLRRETRRSPQ
jgi:hypothetical protein